MILRHGAHTLLLALTAIGCAPFAVPAQSTRPARGWSAPETVCEIDDARIDEASGLTASRRNPGLYFTHNDSAGKPYVYAIDRTGRVRAVIRLIGAANLDWEDIAVAPGATDVEFDVCVADIGDNKSTRESVTIYRFPEPAIGDKSDGGNIDARPTKYRCVYEDGARNAEGFAVDPASGDGYIFSKRLDGQCGVHVLRAPWDAGKTNTLRRVGMLKFPAALPAATLTTAADISPDGRRLAVRGYLSGWEWELPTAATGFGAIFDQLPARVRVAAERQGEALCYSADGSALLTISEGTPTWLNEMRREENAETTGP